MKIFGTHNLYGGGEGEGGQPTLYDLKKNVDSTNFNFGTPLGPPMRGKKLIELMI